jgi:hypothetical protein
VPNGNGRETFANGDFYLGSFVNGAKKGKNGKYVWKNHPEFL